MVRISRDRRQSIIIVAIVGATALTGAFFAFGYAYQTRLCACLMVMPSAGKEALNMDSSQFNSPTNVTLNIRNTGTVAITFVSYYVRDSQQHQYASTNWSVPTFPANAVAIVNVIIDGYSFSFTPGNSYTITVVTARNNQFPFTVVG